MGLSRNKVAVSEGAAGSPPFYGECEIFITNISYLQIGKKEEDDERKRTVWKRSMTEICLLFNFQRSETSKACQIFEKEEKQPWEHGGVAQLGEHLPCKQGVMGSIPIISTTGKSGRMGREERDTPKLTWAHSSGG